MDKLKFKDIKIKSQGKQIKEKILEKFNSLDEFANLIDLYPDSLRRYLRSAKMPNSFKLKLVNKLNMGYDEIVLSDIQQITGLVENVFENIEAYRDEKDIKVLKRLKELCLENNMSLEIAKMNRNISIYYYNKKDMGFAIEYMRWAIGGVKNDYDFLVSSMSLLGLMYFFKHDYSKSKDILEKAEVFLPKLKDNSMLFYYYYRRGVLYSCMYAEDPEKIEVSKKMFVEALSFAKENFQLGFAIMNIGLVYGKQGIVCKKQDTFQKAIKYYNEALEIFEEDFNKSVVYNNLADVYKLIGNYEKALHYIKQAFKYLGDKDISKSFIYYQTYVQIKILKGESKQIIEKLKELLERVDDFFIYKDVIIAGIKTIINYGKIYENIEVLQELDDLIVKLVKGSDEEYDKELKACSWDIKVILDNIIQGRRRLGL